MNIATYSKEQGAITTYGIDWAPWLNGRVIVSSSWSVPSGLVNEDDDSDDTTTTIQLSGGLWTQSFIVTNIVTLNTGDIESRSITINIQREQRYCTITEVRARVAKGTQSTATLPDAELDALIEQASRYFDNECGVVPSYFNPAPYPIATDRTFYGDGTNYLRIDPLVIGSIAAVGLPEGYTALDYVVRGNYLVRTGETHILPVVAWYPYLGGWPAGMAVVINAVWGWATTPADVKMAVIELVINLWRETDPAELQLTDLERQPLREKLPPRVAEVARRYRMNVSPAFV